jgi:hypothetical protein
MSRRPPDTAGVVNCVGSTPLVTLARTAPEFAL